MLLTKAEEYLKDVLEHKRCIPYSRYDHSVGRCSAAIQFGLTKGRYPEKSVRIMLNLLKNAKANAETKKLNVEKVLIKNVLVNHATEGRRRTYRAHGSINAYCSSNCHVYIIYLFFLFFLFSSNSNIFFRFKMFSNSSSYISTRINPICFSFFFSFFCFFYRFFKFFTNNIHMTI